jgi:hypothetical protein
MSIQRTFTKIRESAWAVAARIEKQCIDASYPGSPIIANSRRGPPQEPKTEAPMSSWDGIPDRGFSTPTAFQP